MNQCVFNDTYCLTGSYDPVLFNELKVRIKVEIDSWSCVFTSLPPWGRVVSSMIHIASLDHMIQYLFNELKVQIKVEIDS